MYDFTKVNSGEVVKHDFVFTNLGAATLTLSEQETSALDAASDPGPADYPYGGPGTEQRSRKARSSAGISCSTSSAR